MNNKFTFAVHNGYTCVSESATSCMVASIASNFCRNCGQYLIDRGTEFDNTWVMLDRSLDRQPKDVTKMEIQ